MTYQSKAALREEIGHLRARLAEAEEELDIRANWKVIEDRASRNRNEAVVTVATQVVLELVLKALEIPGYDAPCNPSGYYTGGYDTNRFRADLETALRVRAEKAKAAEDAAIEARVAELGKKASPMYASGGYTGYSGTLFGHAYPGETIHSANDVKSQGAENLEYFSKLARTYLTPQPETVEKNIKKSKGDKK